MAPLEEYLWYLDGADDGRLGSRGIDAQLDEDLIEFQGKGSHCTQPSHIKITMLIIQILVVLPVKAREKGDCPLLNPHCDVFGQRVFELTPHFAEKADD